MPLYHTILCAVDFSSHSRRALQVALALAGRGAPRLVALHAIDFLLAQAAAAAYDERRLREDAAAELRTLVAALRPAGAGSAEEPEIVVAVGRPEQVITAAARAHMADLIVMGTQGLGGLRKMFFGSVTEKVLQDAPAPVLAVTASTSSLDAGGLTGVVAAVDFDASAKAVIRHATALAAEFRVPLTLVHVVSPLAALPQYLSAVGEAEAARRQEAQARLDEEAARIRPGVPVRTEVRIGSPAEEIVAVAGEDSGQIVVTGIVGGRLLHRPGSTAYRVLSLSSVPVLAVPPDASGPERSHDEGRREPTNQR